jgi:acyl-CoA reductase-like NAD-dependent aldehyde dehydrogenase
MANYALIIGGKRVDTEQTTEVLNPADGTVVGACPKGTAALLDQAVGAARQALPGWAALPDETRAAKLLEIADLIEKHHAELSALVTREQGKTQSGLGANMEVGGAVVWTRVTAGLKIPEETIQDDAKGKILIRRKEYTTVQVLSVAL